MKKNIIFLFLISLLFISCSLLANNIDNDEKPVQLEKGLYKIPVIINISNDTKAVATPDYSEYIEKLTHVKVTAVNGMSIETNIYPESDGNFKGNIILSAGDWTITAEGISNVLYNSVIYRNNIKISQIYNPSSSEPLKIDLYPVISLQSGETSSGTAELKVTFPKKTTGLYDNYNAYINIDGITNLEGEQTLTLSNTATTTITFNFNTLTAGPHHMNLFITPSGVTETTEFIKIPGSVIVSANMQTNKWWVNGKSYDSLTLTASDLKFPDNLHNYAFYVHGTDGKVFTTPQNAAAAMGKIKAVQFDTIQNAVDTIIAIDPHGDQQWEIGIDGTVKENTDNSSRTMIMINSSVKTPDILLKGYKSGTESAVIDAEEKGRILLVDASKIKKLTIQNLTFENANMSSSDGGAIDIINTSSSTSSEIIIEECNFSNNKVEYSSGCGGAVYVENNVNNITFDRCNFENNVSKSNGGAVFFISNNKNITFINSNFTGNYSENENDTIGNAVAFTGSSSLDNNSLKIENCTFTNNKNTSYSKPSCIFSKQVKLYLINCIFDNQFINENQYDIYNGNKSNIYLSGKNIINSVFFKIESSSGEEINNPFIIQSIDSASNIKYKMEKYDKEYILVKRDSSCTSTIDNIISKFECLDSQYDLKKVDNDKAKVSEKSTGINPLFVIVGDDKLSFVCDNPDLTFGHISTQYLKVKINDSDPALCNEDFTDINVILYCGVHMISDSELYNVHTGELSLPSDLSPDNYELAIKGKYKGINFSQTIDISVKN